MDRPEFYYGEILRNFDLLSIGQDAMAGLAQLTQAVLGQAGSVAIGLGASPGGGLTLAIAAGQFYQLANLEATAMGGGGGGGLPINTTQILKQGLSLTAQTVTGFLAPATVGQSINYLVEAQYQDQEYGTVILPYYNASKPAAQYSGPGNNTQMQSYARKGIVALQAKAGAAATTGSQTTPAGDSGWTGLYVVTLAYGAATIVSGNIAPLAGAPLLAGLLNSHHSGGAGQAPKILMAELASASSANAGAGLSSVYSYAGNPNTLVAGVAGIAGASSPDVVWDTVNNIWWVCTASGNAASAVWTEVGESATWPNWCGTSTGTANAQIVAPPSSMPTFSTGAMIVWKIGAGLTNTSATTATVGSFGTFAVRKDGPTGPIALTGGELVAGNIASARYDGANLQLTATELGTAALANASSNTGTVAAVYGAIASGHVAGFNDALGTLKDLGPLVTGSQFITTNQVLSPGFFEVDTSAGPVTITLEPTPNGGDAYQFFDASGTFAQNNLILNPNGATIQGMTTNLLCDVAAIASFNIVYKSGNWSLQ